VPRLWIVVCCLTLIGCDRKSPPPAPVVNPPATSETVTGTERVGWNQPAADAVELATIGYVIYVDGVRTELAGVTCASAAAAASFPCSARLPPMSVGPHALQLASFVNDGSVLESARSAPLLVTLVGQGVFLGQTFGAAAVGEEPRAADAKVVSNGMTLRGELVAAGLEWPTDLAFAQDGRLFVAERRGRIRIIRDGRLLSEPAVSLADTLGAEGQLLALALDPQFERTRHVFAIYTELSRPGDRSGDRSGEPMFTLARFREVSDTLGDRAVLLSGVPASSPSPAAALRFGPDGKLYAAFDDGGDARRSRDAGSLNGKVLRLNPDGTTPRDATGATPVYADGYLSPVALDWDPVTATLWVADRSAGASRFAFYRGTLFPGWAGRLLSASDKIFGAGLTSGPGGVAVGPDGAIYFGTAGGVGRLVPDRAP
jgi:glucose/arabinose dehydrogenase